jgi:Sortase domain
MNQSRWWPARGHRGLASTVVIGLLAASGAVCVGVAVTHQHAPRPPTNDSIQPAPNKTDPPQPSPNASSPKPARVALVLPASVPIALTIAAIGVKTRLQRVGQAADGSLEVPAPGPTYDVPGWYRYSPTPGALGPSVIVGHVDSAAHGPSVFWRLGSLKVQDLVRVTRADGSVAIFAIDDVRRFRKTRFPTRLVYGNTDHAALRLITCGGPLEAGHYRDNIVVLASLVRQVLPR